MVPAIAEIIGSRPGAIVHLGGQQNIFAPAVSLQCLTDDALTFASGINIGTVDKVHPGIDRRIDNTKGLIFFRRIAKVHRTQDH